MVYTRMTYVVRHEDEMSTEFRARMGILIGDTSSPILWTLYLADFYLRGDHDDIALAGAIIANLEQADDIILLSTTAVGAQKKMTALWQWCQINFMTINAIKSFVMIFGPLPPVRPLFWFGGTEVKVTGRQTYVGLTLCSTTRNIFAEHYSNKASKTRAIGNTILGLESMIGTLPPWEGKKLYMSLMDPHLTHGCEIALDVDEGILKGLEDVQTAFLRRLLGLNKRAMLAPLYTETSVVPLRFRRLNLALRYLQYLISLPNERYARAALNDSIQLAAEGKPSWVMDLEYVLHKLPFRATLPNLKTATVEDIEQVIKCVQTGMEKYLQSCIDNSPKLYLLWGRLEPEKDSRPRHRTMCFRHYLNVSNADHRKALTRLVLSSHCLALERLRWTEHRRPSVEPHLRRCRFCQIAIESPEHALLECTANADLDTLR
ncbi:hypothetical protein BD779DRAFT_1649417, partial [Infundibulicybe gibba]